MINVASLYCLFRQTNSSKPKDFSFMFINDEEKQQIFTFNELESVDFEFSTSKWRLGATYFLSPDQLIYT